MRRPRTRTVPGGDKVKIPAADRSIIEEVTAGSRIAKPNLWTKSSLSQFVAEDVASQGFTRIDELGTG